MHILPRKLWNSRFWKQKDILMLTIKDSFYYYLTFLCAAFLSHSLPTHIKCSFHLPNLTESFLLSSSSPSTFHGCCGCVWERCTEFNSDCCHEHRWVLFTRAWGTKQWLHIEEKDFPFSYSCQYLLMERWKLMIFSRVYDEMSQAPLP